jgi:hypothetical protein
MRAWIYRLIRGIMGVEGFQALWAMGRAPSAWSPVVILWRASVPYSAWIYRLIRGIVCVEGFQALWAMGVFPGWATVTGFGTGSNVKLLRRESVCLHDCVNRSILFKWQRHGTGRMSGCGI